MLTTVDYCAYGAPMKKTTNFWSSLLGWQPEGATGNGRCNQACASGGWATTESGGRSYVHSVALAQAPRDGFQGAGGRKSINAVPEALHQEILQHFIAGRSSSKANVVIDLCAGYGSLEPVVRRLGLRYCAVDIKAPLREEDSK